MKLLTCLLLILCFAFVVLAVDTKKVRKASYENDDDHHGYDKDHDHHDEYNQDHDDDKDDDKEHEEEPHTVKYLKVNDDLRVGKEVVVGEGANEIRIAHGELTVGGVPLAQGAPGEKGNLGPTGENGKPGDRGSQGVRGRRGARGKRGLQGGRGNERARILKISPILNRNGESVKITEDRSNIVVGDNIRVTVDSSESFLANNLLYVVGVGYFRVTSINDETRSLNLVFERRGHDNVGNLRVGDVLASVGEQGVKGIQGDIGNQGINGPTGPQGVQGDQGDQGAVGERGPEGKRGERGPEGPEGRTGRDGQAGVPGRDGPNGPDGERGPIGERGVIGEAGPAGPQGAVGPTGEVGPTGPEGPQGRQGEQGGRGREGYKGDQGVVGPAGPQGEAGPTGEVGPAGKQGPKGKRGDAFRFKTYTETFNYFLPSVSTNVGKHPDFTYYFDAVPSNNLNQFSNLYTKVGANPVSAPQNNKNLLSLSVESYTKSCNHDEALVDGSCNWNLFKYIKKPTWCRAKDFVTGPRGCTNCVIRVDETKKRFFDGERNVDVVRRLTYNRGGAIESVSLNGASCKIVQLFELSDDEVSTCGFFCFFHDIETIHLNENSVTCRYIPPQNIATALNTQVSGNITAEFAGKVSVVTVSVSCQDRVEYGKPKPKY